MEKFEGTTAVQNARSAVMIFAWISILTGVLLLIKGLNGENSYYLSRSVIWTDVYVSIACFINGMFCFIGNAILKGFQRIVEAKEIYLDKIETKKMEKIDNMKLTANTGKKKINE